MGHLTLPRHEIVDRGAFYELTFFCISPKNLLGDFFYSLNARVNLGEVVKRVHLNKESFVLEKRGIPVAAVLDIDELEADLKTIYPSCASSKVYSQLHQRGDLHPGFGVATGPRPHGDY